MRSVANSTTCSMRHTEKLKNSILSSRGDILVDPARLHLHLRLDHHVRDTSIQPTNVVLRQRAIRLAQHSHHEFPIANATHFSFAPSRNQLSELSHETQQY